MTLIKIANNKRILKIFHDFHLVTRYHRRRKIYTSGSRLIVARDEHQQIIEAIKNKETQILEDLIHNHIESGRNTILESYESYKKEQLETDDFFEY
ncbi:MAG: FCD domain-containing protein [Cytophagales bacterium]|nr:FCD domain-containing protein [Cytophagales bacterium]